MDVVILTERRYAGTPADTGPVKGYVDNLLLEDHLVADALRGRGLLVDRRAWCDKEVDWSSTRSALFRTTWDYFDRWDEFAPWLDAAAKRTRFFNSPELVRWNLDKHYLHDLELAGVQVVPTAYISQGEHVPLLDVAAQRGWTEVVIKPAIAGGAVDTYFVNLSGDVHVLSPEPPRKEDSETLWRSLVDKQDMLVQPFLPNVMADGETSLIWIDSAVTHGVLKRAKSGDFRVQDDHGGTVEVIDVSPEDKALAEDIMAVCLEECRSRQWEPPLYARVDLMRGPDGQLLLSELEMVEPELWFRFHPPAADALAQAVAERLAL